MDIRIQHLAMVGQVVNHWDRHHNVMDSLSRYKGLTAYSLSKLICVHPSTAHAYLNWLEEHGFVEREVNGYLNTERHTWFPTQKAIDYWFAYRHTETGKIVSAWVAKQWMQWYTKQVRETHKKLDTIPMFRV